MQRIVLHKSESLYERKTGRIIEADEIQLDRENGVVRIIVMRSRIPVIVKTQSARGIFAMRRSVFGDIIESPVLTFDFINEF